MQYDIQMVIIDYLQLMTAGSSKGGGNREQEISSISRSIKEIAKELNIPIIALSQLSRSVEQRGGDKRPVLSDLRESGAIEQDADIVTFIYRPEYYNLTENEDGRPTENRGDIIIAKNRHGSLDTVHLKFVKHLVKFTNMDDLTFEDTMMQGNSISANHEFENAGNTITMQSKMDNMPNEDWDFEKPKEIDPF
jgi:replicative DNA helicase